MACISFKDVVNNTSYEKELAGICTLIRRLYRSFRFLQNDKSLDDHDRDRFRRYLGICNDTSAPEFEGVEELVATSLCILSELLCKAYGRKTVFLIDEFDTPLLKAQAGNFAERMRPVIESMLGAVMKPDDSSGVAKCILAGVLNVLKGSVITSPNHARLSNVSGQKYAALFGFTPEETDLILDYYQEGNYCGQVIKRYDGYRFGREKIFCPWDILCYCSHAAERGEVRPQNFWADSSGNALIYEFIDQADRSAILNLQTLLDGSTLEYPTDGQFCLPDLKRFSGSQFFALMYQTGYLTAEDETCGREQSREQDDIGQAEMGSTIGRDRRLKIPNREITELFLNCAADFFDSQSVFTPVHTKAAAVLLFDELLTGNAEAVEFRVNQMMLKRLSAKGFTERISYEAFFSSMLRLCDDGDRIVHPDLDAENGYLDLALSQGSQNTVAVLALMKADSDTDEAMLQAADLGLARIENKCYPAVFMHYGHGFFYGIGFCGRQCKVKVISG